VGTKFRVDTQVVFRPPLSAVQRLRLSEELQTLGSRAIVKPLLRTFDDGARATITCGVVAGDATEARAAARIVLEHHLRAALADSEDSPILYELAPHETEPEDLGPD
jgi:hypothetical protein